MAKLSSTHIYGDLMVDSAITENGQLLSSKYAPASHGTHLTLGTGSGNAYRGDYGNTAYNHSQAAHAPSNAQKNSDITKAEIEAKLTGAITSHTHAYSPTSHASTATTYGVSSASNYGHAMASGTTPKANGTAAVGSETAKFARGDHVHPLQTTVSGNAGTATKLATARSINGTNFDGTGNITTANWGTARKINQISVNGSADVKLPLDYYTCNIGSSNAKPYHHILATGQCAGSYTDKSITIVLVNHYNSAGLGIAKATLRTNDAANGATATGELRWLVRSGFAENQLCFNIRNTAKDAYMDVFYKSTGTYNSLTWYVLTEGARGSHGSQWTKYNTHHDNGTHVYDEAGMKAIRTYTSTLQSAVDNGAVNSAKTAAACSGNAATATKFASSQSVALTGDVTGSASSQAGWSVATTLKNSGVTAGSYGPSANASPAHSGTFSVPYITVDAKGRVTAASTRTITLPSDNNTDTKVTYTLGTTTKYYMGGPTATATGTGGITFDTGIYATTTAGQLSVGSFQTRGDITTSGNGSHAIGSTANRFSGIYGANIYSYDKNAKQYASLRLQTEGTADTQGVGRLTAGNSTNAGTAGNAKGQILLYGTNTGYTTITPGYNDTSNITLTLPSAGGTLARTSDNITGSSASCTGNAATATKLKTARTISLGGLLSGSASFDGSGNVSISASIAKPPKSGDWFSGGITTVNTDGVMEIGKYLDFHDSDTTTKDYSTRLQTGGDKGNTITLPTGTGTLALTGHSHSGYLSTGGGTLTGPITVSGESIFHNGTYSDPWSGIGCAIKATGNIGLTGGLRANGGVATLAQACGVSTSDGATYVACLRYGSSRGICDVGTNGIPGRLYIRSGQGSTGSGVSIECQVTNGTNYLQYVAPESGTIALTKHLSDRTRKENIVYIDSEESEFNTKDFYNFIKDDLDLATYNLKKEYAATDTHTKLNFIAQDLLWDFEKNEENKVGNLIVQAEDAMEQQLSLKYDPEVFTSVIAGALKESIDKIEELESEKAKMQAEINELKADLTELKAIVKGLL
jgi:hypothetical protein